MSAIPKDRLLTETDAPFGQTESRVSVPWDVVDTARRLADRYKVEPARVYENALRVLRFAGVDD